MKLWQALETHPVLNNSQFITLVKKTTSYVKGISHKKNSSMVTFQCSSGGNTKRFFLSFLRVHVLRVIFEMFSVERNPILGMLANKQQLTLIKFFWRFFLLLLRYLTLFIQKRENCHACSTKTYVCSKRVTIAPRLNIAISCDSALLVTYIYVQMESEINHPCSITHLSQMWILELFNKLSLHEHAGLRGQGNWVFHIALSHRIAMRQGGVMVTRSLPDWEEMHGFDFARWTRFFPCDIFIYIIYFFRVIYLLY